MKLIPFYFICIIIIITSCNKKNNEDIITLPGKIAYIDHCPYFKDTCQYKLVFFENVKVFTRILERKYKNLVWMHTKDSLYAGTLHDYSKWENRSNDSLFIREPTKSDIVIIDIKGELLDTIFVSDYYEEIISFASSPNDDKILMNIRSFGTDLRDVNPQSNSLKIIDSKSGKTIGKIESLCHYFYLSETVWSEKGDKVVYQLSYREERKEKDKNLEPGVYIYDYLIDSSKMISKGGHNPAWSPDGKYISYIKGDNIYFYDPLTKIHSLFYKGKFNETIDSHRWSLDNKYIRIEGRLNQWSYFYARGYDFLIQVEDGKEVPYVKINCTTFTWKQ